MQRIVYFPVHNPSLHSTPLVHEVLVIEKKTSLEYITSVTNQPDSL